MNKLFSSTASCARLAIAFCLVLAACGDDEGGPVGTGGGGGEGAQGGASATSATSTTSTTSTSAGGAGGGGEEGGAGPTSTTATTGTSGGGGAGGCATCGEALSSPEAFAKELCNDAEVEKAFDVQECACGPDAETQGACNDACPQFCSAEAPPDATCTACLSEQCATALAACQGG